MSIDKLLDEKIKWGKENNVVDEGKETKKVLFLDAIFRVSQYKFHGRSDDAYLEIVKYSSPTGVTLNKPMINILDRVGRYHFMIEINKKKFVNFSGFCQAES